MSGAGPLQALDASRTGEAGAPSPTWGSAMHEVSDAGASK